MTARLLALLGHVRATATVPARWNQSWAFELDKANGPSGVRGLRLIHRLCPFAKAMYKYVGRRAPRWRAPQMHFGCVRGRRRETAILQQQVVSWVQLGPLRGGLLALR